MKMTSRSLAVVTYGFAAMWLVAAPTARASFDITINFTGGLTPSQQAIFTTAKSFWKTCILDYKPGVVLPGMTIDASGSAIDGVGGILGSAGPTSAYTPSGFYYTAAGTMNFDTADLGNMETNGTLLSVIEHEMGHVIGLGTLWTYNGLYTTGTGQYTGANALAAYKTEFNQPSATYVPVELGGGAGTANSHWNEVDGGSANTGIKDSLNRDMKNELMTGWLNSPTFLSNTTIQQFADLGYSVIPEPSAMLMFTLVIGAGVVRRSRRD